MRSFGYTHEDRPKLPYNNVVQLLKFIIMRQCRFIFVPFSRGLALGWIGVMPLILLKIR